ncbi:MAG: hypothetical protein J6Z79_06865 [Clostridia bacterium]|nr:hypothetical protein [Clostridia bacterium]
MIALYVVLGILALVALVLFINVHLVFVYEGEPRAYIRVLFIKLNALKLADKLGGDKKPEKKKKEKREEAKPKEDQTKKKDKGSISDFLDFISLIARIATRAIKDLFRHLHIRLRAFEIRFGAGDADKTALYYGAAIQAANGLFALLRHFTDFKWNNDRLILAPDFTGEHSVFRIRLDLYIKPVFLITLALRALMTFLQGKEQKHERNTAETSH